jgi:hypothetical protein
MADWYASSAGWTAIPQFAISTAYTVGQIIRPLAAPTFAAQLAYRCTTAGTSAATEPVWITSNNATTTTGTAVFTCVGGQSAYGWAAAAGNLWLLTQTASGRISIGDRIYLSSDHAEASANSYTLAGAGFGVVQVISVNRAGAVPPAAADALAGAALAYNGAGAWAFDGGTNSFLQGVTITLGGSGTSLTFNSGGAKSFYFKNCAFVFSTSSTAASITQNNPGKLTFDNTTVQFNNAGQRFASGGYGFDFAWINTPAAMLGTVPTVLFNFASFGGPVVACRGVDLSAVTTTLCSDSAAAGFTKLLLDSCRVAPGVARLSTTSFNTAADEVELVNCYDGTSFISERHTPAGDLTTELTITLSGGAQDNVGAFAHKMVSSTRSDKYVMTLDGFWMDANYSTTGSAKTATVEIISSGTLNADDISLTVEYLGTAGSTRASFASSLPLSLASTSALPTSTATWNSSPATPVKQKLQVTFTPQTAGRVRAQVRLGKPSSTVWVNPQVAIT